MIKKAFRSWLNRAYWFMPSMEMQLHSQLERAYRAGYEAGRKNPKRPTAQ